jgi:DNA-binding transcriptional MocR family regulator
MNPLFAELPTSIFAHMSGLAAEHGAINLGQGFPDFGWPEDVVEKAAEALRSGSNQYAPMRGLPLLREAVADHYRRHQRIDYQVEEITITSGATEALASAIMALVQPGDEVLLFQPLYDAYVPLVRRAGGVPRFVGLTPPDWRITAEAIEAAVSERTRLLIFNNPHNPTARLFDLAELGAIADCCIRHDLVALTDEGLGAYPVRRPHLRAAGGDAGHARADGEGRIGGQDLLADRLEGGLDRCAGRAGPADRQGPPIYDVRDAAQSADGGRLRPRQGRRLFRGDARRLRRFARCDGGGAR